MFVSAVDTAEYARGNRCSAWIYSVAATLTHLIWIRPAKAAYPYKFSVKVRRQAGIPRTNVRG
jgi:hypothetical protein